MSLLSVSQALVVLGVDSVAVVSQERGFKKKIVDHQYVSIDKNKTQQSMDNESAVPTWQSSISQLEHLLNSMQIKAKARLSIILPSELVRYLTLPPQPIYMNSKEKLLYALASYREVYGEIVSDWEIKLQDTPPNQATIAVAVDKGLVDALKQLAVRQKLELASVQPYLTNAMNRLTKQIGKSSGYLVMVEFDRLLLINLNHGNCTNLRTFPLGSDWQDTLKNLMQRELMLSDIKKHEVLVYAPMQKHTAINAIEGWNVKRVGTAKSLINHHRFAMLEAAL